MSGYAGRYTNTVPDVVGAFTASERADMEGPMPGRIVAVSADGKTATVQPTVTKRTYDGRPLPYPELPDVPLDRGLASAGGVTVPLKAGDAVTLTPMGRSTEAFHSGEDGGLGRSFDLSDMVATPSSGSLTGDLPNYDPDNLHIRFGRDGLYGIKGSPDGKMRIDGAEGNVFALLADLAELIGQAKADVQGGSSAGQHDLTINDAAAAIAAKLRAMSL